jgi:flavin reductase (DIM6/NTAB) family NADH-FMN oxidoreductase RutF
MIIQPQELPVQKLHSYLLGAVAPRPIAFASTVDQAGRVNLSPFSFFNVFSSQPPILIFSPARRVRDNSIKHTLSNVQQVPEVCINIVSYAMVEQASLASCEYPAGVNEFVKAGFTEEPSRFIQPPRVAESPVSFECRVNQVIPMGTQGGAGNLIVAEVLLMRIKDEILDANGRIDPHKLDAVARMGADFYCRASGPAVFEVPKPNEKSGLGVDRLPAHVWRSDFLTGNDLGRLGNLHELPAHSVHQTVASLAEVQTAMAAGLPMVHQLARKWIVAGELGNAWALLELASVKQ